MKPLSFTIFTAKHFVLLVIPYLAAILPHPLRALTPATPYGQWPGTVCTGSCGSHGRVSDCSIPYEIADRQHVDASINIAETTETAERLGWRIQSNLEDIYREDGAGSRTRRNMREPTQLVLIKQNKDRICTCPPRG